MHFDILKAFMILRTDLIYSSTFCNSMFNVGFSVGGFSGVKWFFLCDYISVEHCVYICSPPVVYSSTIGFLLDTGTELAMSRSFRSCIQVRSLLLAKATSQPGPFEAQPYFHALVLLENCTLKKLVSTTRKYLYSRYMRWANAVQLAVMAPNRSTRAAEIESIQNVLLAYVFYNNRRAMFSFLDSREQW